MLALPPLSLPDRPGPRALKPRAQEQRLATGQPRRPPQHRPPKHRPPEVPECGYGFDRRGCHDDGGGPMKRYVHRQSRPRPRHRPGSRPAG